jgi:hypothetical protein
VVARVALRCILILLVAKMMVKVGVLESSDDPAKFFLGHFSSLGQLIY